MKTFMIAVLCLLLGMVSGIYLGHSEGHIAAYKEVARECRDLGGFYVGSTIFECALEDYK